MICSNSLLTDFFFQCFNLPCAQIMTVATLFTHSISSINTIFVKTANEDCAYILSGGLASRVKRKDTLALKLERQLEKEQSQDQENNAWNNKEQWEAIRNKIGTTLTRSATVCVHCAFMGSLYCPHSHCVYFACSHRRLSQRPTAQELEQRNILLGQSYIHGRLVLHSIFCCQS